MSILNENIIPGKHGKIFTTDAKGKHNLSQIKTAILTLSGVDDVIVNFEVFPTEFTIFTSKLVSIKEIEKKARTAGFHAISKNIFEI
jgi:hypothetical protein